MNKIASLVLCSVAIIFAQQAEQQVQPQPQPQPQVQIQQPQVQPELPQPQPQPQVQVQVVQQPPQVQLPPLQPQTQTNCPQPLPKPTYGLQARFNLNSVSYGFLSKKNDGIGMGIGFGGGVIRSIPLTNSLDVNPEISFITRNLYSQERIHKDKDGKEEKYWEDETEFVMSIIPVLVQFTPFEFPLYVGAGFQVDLPMLAKITNKDEETERFGDRVWYDLGVVLAVGYNITERFSFNLRSVVGLTSITGKRADARTPIQYSIGVTYF